MQPTLAVSQNVLHSRALVDRLLAASSIQPGDLVLDLGAGPGLITERLVHRGCRVIAVEQDPVLVARLIDRFQDVSTVSVCPSDILRLRLPRQPYKVFANVPFNATAAIVSRLVRAARPPEDAYLMVQREAAERFVGKPRTTLVAVLLMPWFEASVVHHFRRTDFTPMPRVDVMMLRLRKRGPPLVSPEHARLFRDFVVAVFTSHEVTLTRGLGRLIGTRRARRLIPGLGLDLAVTPSSLGLPQWPRLFEAFLGATGADAQWLVAGAERRLRQHQRRLVKVHRTRASGKRRYAGCWAWSRRHPVDSACRPPPTRRPRSSPHDASARSRHAPPGRRLPACPHAARGGCVPSRSSRRSGECVVTSCRAAARVGSGRWRAGSGRAREDVVPPGALAQLGILDASAKDQQASALLEGELQRAG